MTPLVDDDLRRLYARMLLSIVRADGEIDAEEGERLKERQHELQAKRKAARCR